MNTATANENMKISHAQQHAIFSKYSWTTDGRIRVQCTHRTEALLKLAGVHSPKPLEYYPIPAKRDLKGFLIIDRDLAIQRPPIAESDDSLYEQGGIFADFANSFIGEALGNPIPIALIQAAGDPVNVVNIQAAIAARQNHSQRCETTPEIAAEIAALCEIPATRTFEISTGPLSKIRVQMTAFFDDSIPSPNEREKWSPKKPSDTAVYAAVSALHLSRRLADLEQI